MMLNETHIDYIKDFPNPKSVFPTANISGGVCFSDGQKLTIATLLCL